MTMRAGGSGTVRLVAVGLILALAVGGTALAQGTSTVRVVRAAAILEQPQGAATAVGTANVGDLLEVLDQRDGWLLVRPPSGNTASWRTGWINGTSTETMSRGGDAPSAAPAPAPGQAGPTLANRKGFIIGLGGGVGLHQAPVFPGFSNSPSTTNLGIVTDFKIGYAPTDQLLIYYNNQVAWTQNENYDVIGVSGVGVNYFFRKTTPGPFVTGTVGAGAAAEVDFGTGRLGSNERGSAFDIGGGWEFARHWSVQGNVTFVRLGRGNNHTVLSGTLHWLFY